MNGWGLMVDGKSLVERVPVARPVAWIPNARRLPEILSPTDTFGGPRMGKQPRLLEGGGQPQARLPRRCRAALVIANSQKLMKTARNYLSGKTGNPGKQEKAGGFTTKDTPVRPWRK